MAELPRFFVPADALAGDPVILGGDTLHHLRTVLRLDIGREVLLLDGAGNGCRARLRTIGRDRAEAVVSARWRESEALCPLRLIQSLPKGDKFDLVLQKGTELGVTTFQPALSGRGVARPEGGRAERWARIVREAARQSRRPVLPRLMPLLPLTAALQTVDEPLRLVLWEQGAEPLAALLPAVPPAGVAVLVGPEGGFSPAEVAAVGAAGFRAVHLGPRILRTETAGLAVAAVLQYLYGDWGRAAHVRNDQNGGE